MFTRKETQIFQADVGGGVPRELLLPASISSCKQDVKPLSLLGPGLRFDWPSVHCGPVELAFIGFENLRKEGRSPHIWEEEFWQV